MLRRIEEAARFCPLDQLSLSAQCGFASVAGGNALTEAQQWAKLELIVKTAERVWGRGLVGHQNLRSGFAQNAPAVLHTQEGMALRIGLNYIARTTA